MRLRQPRRAGKDALGGKVVSVDLFDKPATLAKLWDRLLQGIALDALADSKCRASG